MEIHPHDEAAINTGVIHRVLSEQLSRRISERNAAWHSAPYGGAGAVKKFQSKIDVLARKIQKNQEQSSTDAPTTKSISNKVMKGIRDFNRREREL